MTATMDYIPARFREFLSTKPKRQRESKIEAPVVLVVDDDQDFVDMQAEEFEAIGFEVVTAGGEAQAREILERQQPDVVLVDLMMEHADAGFCLSHHIKDKYPAVPVIMVTSAGSITGTDFESMSGPPRKWIHADALLSKPVRFDQIERELVRLLKGK